MSVRKMYPVRLRRPRDPQESRRRRTHLLAGPTAAPLPFRWDISRPETLANIGEDKSAYPGANTFFSGYGIPYRTTYDGFLEELLACAARTVASAGNADIVFVGRAPESLFDLLSGLTAHTSWQQETRLTLLRFSMGNLRLHFEDEAALSHLRQSPTVTALHRYMETLGLSPAKLIVRERPVALVDLVCSGTTIRCLLHLIHDWAVARKADWPAVRRKLRAAGIVDRCDEEPPRPFWKRRQRRYTFGQWKPDKRCATGLLESGALREVSVSSKLWDCLGNWQSKSTPSYPPDKWGTDEAAHPSHEPYYLAGLQTARQLYEAGCTRAVRARFTTLLAAEETAMREAWCRTLIGEIGKRSLPL